SLLSFSLSTSINSQITPKNQKATNGHNVKTRKNQKKYTPTSPIMIGTSAVAMFAAGYLSHALMKSTNQPDTTNNSHTIDNTEKNQLKLASHLFWKLATTNQKNSLEIRLGKQYADLLKENPKHVQYLIEEIPNLFVNNSDNQAFFGKVTRELVDANKFDIVWLLADKYEQMILKASEAGKYTDFLEENSKQIASNISQIPECVVNNLGNQAFFDSTIQELINSGNFNLVWPLAKKYKKMVLKPEEATNFATYLQHKTDKQKEEEIDKIPECFLNNPGNQTFFNSLNNALKDNTTLIKYINKKREAVTNKS
ncbi:MAG: hypothetical protein AAF380_01160, partial [Bacteroidota bacterium]